MVFITSAWRLGGKSTCFFTSVSAVGSLYLLKDLLAFDSAHSYFLGRENNLKITSFTYHMCIIYSWVCPG